MAGVRWSTEVRFGPDPRTSIRARGQHVPHREAGHTEAPDHMPQAVRRNACINGGVHTRPAVCVTKLGLDVPGLEVGVRRTKHADEGAGDIGRRIQYMGKRLRCSRLARHRPVQNDVGQYAHDLPSAVCPSNAVSLAAIRGIRIA